MFDEKIKIIQHALKIEMLSMLIFDLILIDQSVILEIIGGLIFIYCKNY